MDKKASTREESDDVEGGGKKKRWEDNDGGKRWPAFILAVATKYSHTFGHKLPQKRHLLLNQAAFSARSHHDCPSHNTMRAHGLNSPHAYLASVQCYLYPNNLPKYKPNSNTYPPIQSTCSAGRSARTQPPSLSTEQKRQHMSQKAPPAKNR